MHPISKKSRDVAIPIPEPAPVITATFPSNRDNINLGLRKFLEENGHTLVVTSDKDSKGCIADKELVDADIVISQPFWPYYLTRERIESAKNLKMAITAGIGSDHVDLQAAIDNKVDVVEVTYCNSRSVSEHIVMMILAMVRDYHNQHRIVNDGGWHIADLDSSSAY